MIIVQSVAGQSRKEATDWVRVVWIVDAFLWLMFVVSLALIGIERFFGVLSGFTLLIGPLPALLLSLSLNIGVAATLASMTHAGERLAKLMAPVRVNRPEWLHRSKRATREATAPQPEWKVRTAPRSAGRNGTASQRIMEMEL